MTCLSWDAFKHSPTVLALPVACARAGARFLCDRALEACFDALADHRPLKFSKGASDLENELAHRRGRVDGLLV
jgi:hypothetical protein